jgi:hypothetical protein
VESAVGVNEAQLLKFAHEQIDSRPRGANHLRQHFLRYPRDKFVGLIFLPVTSEYQKSASQPFLGGIEELIDQIFLDSYVPGDHMLDETIGERMFGVQNPYHFVLFNDQ